VRKSQRFGILFVGLLAVVALGLRGAPTHAATPPPADPASIDDLLRVFDVGSIPADFVIVVDTSGSMSSGPNPPYPEVKAAYAGLVQAIGNGDHLSVVTFSDAPSVNFERTIDSDGARQAALRALPDVANGPATDIGSALNATLDRLSRVDASEVEIVLFLTDGMHEPPPNSPYAQVGSAAWAGLQQHGQAVAASHLLQVYGVGLGNGDATDVGLLRGVLPNPSIVSLPPDQLSPFFLEAVKQSQLVRLRKPLQRELDVGFVEAALPRPPRLAPHETFEVEITSKYRQLPADVTLPSIAVTDDSGRVADVELVGGPRSLHLRPGQSEKVSVRATLPVKPAGWRVPEKHERQTVTLTLSGASTAEPADLINRVFSFSTSKGLTSPAPIVLRRTVGHTWAWFLTALALLAAAVVALALFLRWLLVPPPLVGYFELAGDAGQEGRRPVRLSGKRMVIDHRRLAEAGAASIEVFTRPRKRKRVFAVPGQGDFEVQDRRRFVPVTHETELSSAGIYRIGGARVRWWRAARRG